MRIKVPITGELISYDPDKPGEISGNPDNPVRPVNLTALLPGVDFAWQAIEYDPENGFVELEATFKKKIIITEWDKTKDPPEPITWHGETDAEFEARKTVGEQAILNMEKQTSDKLYEMTGEPKLKKPIRSV